MLPRNIPLIALVALDDDVRLGVLPKSVDLILFNRKMVACCRTTEFKFCRGEFFLCTQHLYTTVARIKPMIEVYVCTTTLIIRPYKEVSRDSIHTYFKRKYSQCP